MIAHLQAATGNIVQIQNNVVDVKFRVSETPAEFTLLEVKQTGKQPLALEVQVVLGGGIVRTIALGCTKSLSTGMNATDTGTSNTSQVCNAQTHIASRLFR